MCVNERIKEVVNFLKENNLIRNQQHFCDIIGYNKSALSLVLNNKIEASQKLVKAIQDAYPDIPQSFFESGTGTLSSITKHNVADANKMLCEPCEVEELPIIPAKIVNAPAIDVYKYITENDTETAPVVQQFPDSTAFYRIKTHAMEPNICAGDMLALAAYPQGGERIVPGDPYSVDTNTNGLVTRLLYNHPDGFLARSYNPDKYPDFVISREEIIRIFRIVGLLRINVQ